MLVRILCQTVSKKKIDSNDVLWNKTDLLASEWHTSQGTCCLVFVCNSVIKQHRETKFYMHRDIVNNQEFWGKSVPCSESQISFKTVLQKILVTFSYRVLETTSNAASSVHSKKSKNKHQAEAEKQKAEAEAKAAKDREEVGSFVHNLFVIQSLLESV